MISADTLFHFTKSLDNINNILTNNFSPRYCLENIKFLSRAETFEYRVPLVSFCDIPLSQINNHINTYGNYALGLKKEWAIENGISPILYLYNDSNTHRIIKGLYGSIAKLDRNNQIFFADSSISKSTIEFIDFLFYCKDYKGDMWRDNNLMKNINFWFFIKVSG